MRCSGPSDWEIYLTAFGPDPDPESDGAGRDAYEAMMRQRQEERRERILEERRGH